MYKQILLFAAAILLAISIEAQNTTFNAGDKVLNLGLGFGSTTYTGALYSVGIPPLSASLEVNVVDELFDEYSSIGVGGYLGFSSYNYSNTSFSNFILGGRGAFHYEFIEQLDTYAGLLLGYRSVSWRDTGFGSIAGGGFVSAFYIGGRYYFTDNLAAMLELGYGIAYLNLGVAFKF
jgi:hypothetical protein